MLRAGSEHGWWDWVGAWNLHNSASERIVSESSQIRDMRDASFIWIGHPAILQRMPKSWDYLPGSRRNFYPLKR